MAVRKGKKVADPVVPIQGSREMAGDPGNGAREDAVRRRAYELFEKRGRKHGYDLQDWLDAEVQVKAERWTVTGGFSCRGAG